MIDPSDPTMIHRGRVVSFDSASGLGHIDDESGAEFDFHATAVADGQRTIDVGAAVFFRRFPGRRGRWEADRIVPISL